MKLIVKAKYTRRWKGPDGKWRYSYGEKGRKTSGAKKPERVSMNVKMGLGSEATRVTPSKWKDVYTLTAGKSGGKTRVTRYKLGRKHIADQFRMYGSTFAVHKKLGSKGLADTGWTVTELSTGHAIAHGTSPVRATEEAYTKMTYKGKDYFQKMVGRAKTKMGMVDFLTGPDEVIELK